MSHVIAKGTQRNHNINLTGSGGLGAVAADGAELDVESGDAERLDLLADVLGGQHGGVGRGLVPVGLDLHAAGDAAEGLAAGEVGHVDEGVVEGGEDVRHGHHLDALADLGAELDLEN